MSDGPENVASISGNTAMMPSAGFADAASSSPSNRRHASGRCTIATHRSCGNEGSFEDAYSIQGPSAGGASVYATGRSHAMNSVSHT